MRNTASAVAVCDPLPIFAQGLCSELKRADFAPEPVSEDVEGWLGQHGQAALVLTVCCDEDWERLRNINMQHPLTIILVLLTPASSNTVQRALDSGARSALPRTTNGGNVARALVCSLAAETVVPASMFVEPAQLDAVKLSDDELGWLRSLATGMPVETLAWQAGYSRRTMYRRLNRLYRTLGETRRTEALLAAQRAGLVN